MTEEQLVAMLWRIDPMRTCCNVNPNMADEYIREARAIAHALAHGADPRTTVVEVFEEWFWEGCMETRQWAVDAILAGLAEAR